MATYTDLIAGVRKSIRTVSLEQIKERLDGGEPMILVDVREKEEYRQGFIPGALSVPRGFLEMQVEKAVPDKSAPVVLYCAGGTRSALAARTLAELGYQSVESATLGFTRWKDLGLPVARPPELSEAQRSRYSRHIMLDEVGEAGQAKLLASKVLLLGAGGLGSPAAMYLAAAGVGTIGLVDLDVVDASNLQRQILHATSRLGTPKVDSAEKTLTDLNPDVKVVKYEERLDSSNVERIFKGWDIVVDGCDNFPTRYLVNDASVFLGIPVVHGSIFRFEGQVTTFMPRAVSSSSARASSASGSSARASSASGSSARASSAASPNAPGPCYRCLYPEPPPPHLAPSCAEAGVLGILPGLVGTMQATEAIKYLLGKGDLLKGRLVCYDSLRMKFRELKLRRDPSCPVCGDNPTITEYIDYEQFCSAR